MGTILVTNLAILQPNMKSLFLFPFWILISSFLHASIEKHTLKTWRNLLKNHSDCVTWVSVNVRIEISANGQSFPPSERKLEALGTVLHQDGLTVLSLNQVDPTYSILSRMRSPTDVKVDYTEVMILSKDGREIPSRFLLKDEDLDLAFILPDESKNVSEKNIFQHVSGISEANASIIEPLDQVVSLSKLDQNLYRQPILTHGFVNTVITKPRNYLVIEKVTPGAPVFNDLGKWLGVTVFKKENKRPTEVITIPSEDILELAEQVRIRTK